MSKMTVKQRLMLKVSSQGFRSLTNDEFTELLLSREYWFKEKLEKELCEKRSIINKLTKELRDLKYATRKFDGRSRISVLKLSKTTESKLEKIGVNNIRKLLMCTKEDLMSNRGFGLVSLNDVKNNLLKHNMDLQQSNRPVSTYSKNQKDIINLIYQKVVEAKPHPHYAGEWNVSFDRKIEQEIERINY